MKQHWKTAFLRMASEQAALSKDPSTKVGAVIVDSDTRKLVSTGFNGFAHGVDDSDERLNDRDVKYPLTIHAEVNAICFAGDRVGGTTMFTTRPPCVHCASLIAQTKLFSPPGIVKVVSIEPPEEFIERWNDSLELASRVLDEAGIEVEWINEAQLGFKDAPVLWR
jgi:dCMP deaminase